jgi:hypothetical protein
MTQEECRARACVPGADDARRSARGVDDDVGRRRAGDLRLVPGAAALLVGEAVDDPSSTTAGVLTIEPTMADVIRRPRSRPRPLRSVWVVGAAATAVVAAVKVVVDVDVDVPSRSRFTLTFCCCCG